MNDTAGFDVSNMPSISSMSDASAYNSYIDTSFSYPLNQTSYPITSNSLEDAYANGSHIPAPAPTPAAHNGGSGTRSSRAGALDSAIPAPGNATRQILPQTSPPSSPPPIKKEPSGKRQRSGKRKTAQPQEQVMKRRVQNRAAQRSFRERQKEYVHDLEQQVEQLRLALSRLSDDYRQLVRAVSAPPATPQQLPLCEKFPGSNASHEVISPVTSPDDWDQGSADGNVAFAERWSTEVPFRAEDYAWATGIKMADRAYTMPSYYPSS